MLYNPLLVTAFYGAFALFALAATWGKDRKAQVGIVLALCWVASNAMWWVFPLEWRPAVFPILDVIFALTAAKAARETGSRVPLVLIALSVMAIAANTAFSILGAGSWRQVSAYEITLNVIFVLQCIVTGGWGAADVVGRFIGFHPRPAHLRGDSQLLGLDDEAP